MNERTASMHEPTIAAADLDALAAFDTPTICNALEVVMPEIRKGGYTVRPLLCGFPDMAPVVGYARTATPEATFHLTPAFVLVVPPKSL